MYNSVSIAICGHEHYATELRLRTALELVEHKNFYVDQGKASHLDLCSKDIEKTDRRLSSHWKLFLSMVYARCKLGSL